MIDMDTPLFRKAPPGSVVGSTIRSIFSVRSSAAVAAEFSRVFLVVVAAAGFRFALRYADHAGGSRIWHRERNRNSQAGHLRSMQRQRRRARLPLDQLSNLRRARAGDQFSRFFPGVANLSALPGSRTNY